MTKWNKRSRVSSVFLLFYQPQERAMTVTESSLSALTFNLIGHIFNVLFDAFQEFFSHLVPSFSASRAHEAVNVVKPTHNIVTSSHKVSDAVKGCERSQNHSNKPLVSSLRKKMAGKIIRPRDWFAPTGCRYKFKTDFLSITVISNLKF